MWALLKAAARWRPRGRERRRGSFSGPAADATAEVPQTPPPHESPLPTPPAPPHLPATVLQDLPAEILLMVADYLPFNRVHRLGSPFPLLCRTLRAKMYNPISVASRAVRRCGSVEDAFCAELKRDTLDPHVMRALADFASDDTGGSSSGANGGGGSGSGGGGSSSGEPEPHTEPEPPKEDSECPMTVISRVVARFAARHGPTAGLNLVRAACRGGHTDLLRCIAASMPGARELLISNVSCHVDAALSRTPSLLRFLIHELGADMYAEDQAAFFAAVQVDGTACIRVFLDADADRNQLDVGRALELAAFMNNTSTFYTLFRSSRGRAALQTRADLEGQMLHFCAASGLEEPLRVLAPDATPRAKAAAVISAARRGYARVVRALLETGDVPRHAAAEALEAARNAGETACVLELEEIVGEFSPTAVTTTAAASGSGSGSGTVLSGPGGAGSPGGGVMQQTGTMGMGPTVLYTIDPDTDVLYAPSAEDLSISISTQALGDSALDIRSLQAGTHPPPPSSLIPHPLAGDHPFPHPTANIPPRIQQLYYDASFIPLLLLDPPGPVPVPGAGSDRADSSSSECAWCCCPWTGRPSWWMTVLVRIRRGAGAGGGPAGEVGVPPLFQTPVQIRIRELRQMMNRMLNQ
ncbi:hypothetical protein M427DRAFT_302627 [Gonapodya prolifera JEL478]|uniref:Uncharacterized protein n=1 Tax=Gonapodya prolifera (strain JEL478) TaxID=1344416 RepID=A0A139AI39_GONPJ|nr:hypothetical protein M427DRAFT_302627 [Gonapodya prolifera JEL478]|eukprot:KXS16204.1 hypothetical protein M427DRAFT_302627 [Gonapodya prolifera JEL478]